MLKFFIHDKLNLIKELLNLLIPSDKIFPAAGDLGVYKYIDDKVIHNSNLQKLYQEGFNFINDESYYNYNTDFLSLELNKKYDLLKNVEKCRPKFFNNLLLNTYNGYYTNNHILNLLGPHTRPPQPLGYNIIEEVNINMLKKVINRGNIYKN